MKKILLTGSTGFIGRNILPILQKKYDVYAPKRQELNLLDFNSVEEYLKSHKFDAVIQGANPNPVKNTQSDKPETMLEDSMRIFMNFYQMRGCYGKMLYFGSGAEYGKNRDIILASEEQIGTTVPLDSYGLAKLWMNELARNSSNIYNLRIFGCFGPYDHESKFLTHVIRSCLRQKTITIRQNCIFDYMQVYDLAEVVSFFIEDHFQYHDYNVCTGRPISLYDIACKIKEKMRSENSIVILKDGWNKEYTGSNKRLLQELPRSFAFTTIEDGIDLQIAFERRLFNEEARS
ncbi:MAG: NAD-dependent epimerase/dehydratase family protein [Lachnospiraceae bacterium]|nr:NAD-dependent epimerase/dehydratase family protein [Lachnospiraceae bacterium]